MASVLTQRRPPGGWRDQGGQTFNAYGQQINAAGQTINQATGQPINTGGGSSRSSPSNTALNSANAAANATAMAEYNRQMAQPHGLEQGFSVNQGINYDDKGSDGKKMENLETFDEQLSQLKGVLTLAKQWIAPERPSLLSTDNRIDPGNSHGSSAVYGDRQDSQSDRNSSNYSGPGRSNPTNRSSGVGKSGKKR
jgi:hypothetical protein